MTAEPLLQSQVPGHTPRRGKVRDVYDLGDALAVVATDRISAFDWVLPTGIPGKGQILTAMTLFWLKWLDVPNHLISADPADLPRAFQRDELAGRTMLVKKATVVPVECVARGYLLGSVWKEYGRHGTACGVALPPGLQLAGRLPEAIFTPATKAEEGAHDENISFDAVAKAAGADLAAELRAKTLDVYRRAAAFADSKGLILADTKLEWGYLPDGKLILIDEVLTPDSSRYWPKDAYREGESPKSFDKQYVRDWLEASDWDKASPPPVLPEAVVNNTVAKYREALDRLTV